MARLIPDVDPSTARLKAEIGRLRRSGVRPTHWSYRLWQPTMDVVGGAKFTEAGDSIFPGRVTFGQKLIHPQDAPRLLAGRLPSYYEARLDRSGTRLFFPQENTQ